MKIDRPALETALAKFATAGHGLLIGQPGVGKTYSLNVLTYRLSAEGLPYLFLGVDQLGDATDEDLRTGMGFTGTFSDRLEELFMQASAGVLIFDGFDAARSTEVRARILHLIRGCIQRAPQSWSVIVSVRNYDAAKSPALLELFTAVDAPAADADFRLEGIQARHFLVPLLTEPEVLGAVQQIQGLEPLYGHTSPAFRSLLRIPFNLWLIDQVLRRDEGPRLTAISSEVELLQVFWRAVIVDRSDGDLRLLVLANVVDRMIKGRRLSVSKLEALTPELEAPWTALFSDEVLTEVGRDRTRAAFRHNILFDFAVSAIAIGHTPDAVINFISADLSRPLFLRPSIVYYFAGLWHFERAAFWKTFFALLTVEAVAVRLVARLIPPVIIVSETNELKELEPLRVQLTVEQTVGSQAVLRVFQAMRFYRTRHEVPWVQFALVLAHTPDELFAWDLGSFVAQQLQREDGNDRSEIKSIAGTASRLLFQWAWDRRDVTKPWYDSFAAAVVLPSVLKTFDTDHAVSERIVRDVLSLLRTPGFPIRYFYTISDSAAFIAASAPRLAADMYRLIFRHKEESQERTHFGGIIIRLESNRRQDFDMCRYSLAREYSRFLVVAPVEAIKVGTELLAEAARRDVDRFSTETPSERSTFTFLGGQRKFFEDFGRPWRFDPTQDERTIEHALTAFLKSPNTHISPHDALAAYAEGASAAVTWALLLEVGTTSHTLYANSMFELAIARPIQLSSTTSSALGTFIGVATPYWMGNRVRILEKSLLSLTSRRPPPDIADLSPRYRRHIQTWLLSNIDPQQLTLARARRLRARMPARVDAPAGDEGVWVSSKDFTEDDWLKEQGVDVEHSTNTAALVERDKVADFASQWRNEAPDQDAVAAFLPMLRSAYDTLRSLGESAADSRVLVSAWTKLAESADAIARSKPPAASDARDLAAKVLHFAASFPPTSVDPDIDVKYTTAYWSPSPRTEAVQGLSRIAGFYGDIEAAEVVVRMFASPHPAERFLATRYSAFFALVLPDLFWEGIKSRVSLETNPVVALGLFEAISHGRWANDPSRVDLIRSHIGRWLRTDHSELQRAIANWLAHLCWVRSDQLACDMLSLARSEFPSTAELILNVSLAASECLVPRSAAAKNEKFRDKAIAWMRSTLSVVRDRISQISLSPDISDVDLATVRSGHQIIDDLVDRLYFRFARGGDESSKRELNEIGGYYQLIKPVLEDVLEAAETTPLQGLAASTAHRLMELYRVVLPAEPKEIVRLASRTVVLGKLQSYQLDTMAVQEAVALVHTVLTDHREIFDDSEALDALLRLLDVFADVGWPEALALVWRLDEAFR